MRRLNGGFLADVLDQVIQRAAACAPHCTPTDQKFNVLLIIVSWSY